jgi:hypothetical protein
MQHLRNPNSRRMSDNVLSNGERSRSLVDSVNCDLSFPRQADDFISCTALLLAHQLLFEIVVLLVFSLKCSHYVEFFAYRYSVRDVMVFRSMWEPQREFIGS